MKRTDNSHSSIVIQWNPSCEATPFAPDKWPFKGGGLSSGVKINTFMFRFTLSSGLSRGGGLSSGWPLKRGSTVCKRSLWALSKGEIVRLQALHSVLTKITMTSAMSYNLPTRFNAKCQCVSFNILEHMQHRQKSIRPIIACIFSKANMPFEVTMLQQIQVDNLNSFVGSLP